MQWALCSVVHCSSRHTISARRRYYSTCTILFSTLSFHILCLLFPLLYSVFVCVLCWSVCAWIHIYIYTILYFESCVFIFLLFHFFVHSILVICVCLHFSRVGFSALSCLVAKMFEFKQTKMCFQGIHFSPAHIDDVDYNDGEHRRKK